MQSLIDPKPDHCSFTEHVPVTITKTNDSWNDPHPVIEETNSAALTPSNTNELITKSRLPPWLFNTRVDSIDHERRPQGNSTMQQHLTWKLLLNIKVLKLKGHACQYRSKAQQGIGNNTRSPKHQLLEDRAARCKVKQTNPGAVWIRQWWKK